MSPLSTSLLHMCAKFGEDRSNISCSTGCRAEHAISGLEENGQITGSDKKVQFEILNNYNCIKFNATKFIKTIFLSQICRRIRKSLSRGLIWTPYDDILRSLEHGRFFNHKKS